MQVSDKNAVASAVTLEDSWFWDEQTTTGSSASSTHKDNEVTSSKSGSGGDLTLIPLDTPDQNVDKLRRVVEEKDQHFKRLKLENAILQQKVNELTADHADCSANIDALDKEHGVTIEELMQLQGSVKQRCANVEQELSQVKQEKQRLEEVLSKFNDMQDSYNKMERSYMQALTANQLLQEKSDKTADIATQRFQLLEDAAADAIEKEACVVELRSEVVRLNEQLKQKCDENIELLAAHDEKEKELLEKFEYVEVDRERNQAIDLNLQVEVENLTKQLEEQRQIATSETHQRKLIEDKCVELENSVQVLDDKYQQLLEAEPRTHEEFEAFKSEVADSESKLVQENLILQKQLIDLQSDLNSKNIDADVKPMISADAFAELLLKHVKIDASKSSLEEILKYLGDTLSTIDRNRADLDDLTEKFQSLSAEKKRIEHERDTVKADLHHYEIEVGELMKNNELLLVEIDNLKTGKLETISEQNEDNIIILEKQLEDCSNLNQSLEDEYQEMRDQLDRAEMSRAAAMVTVERLEDELQRHESKLKDAIVQIENLEADRSNLLFELNELKADNDNKDDGLASKLQETQAALMVAQKEQIELTSNLGKLQETQAALIVAQNEQSNTAGQLKELQDLLAQRTAQFEHKIHEQQTHLDDKEQLLAKKNIDIEELLEDLRAVKANVDAKEQFAETLLAAELEQLQTKLNSVQQELSASQKSVESLQRISSDYELRLAEKCSQITNMESTLKLLEEKLAVAPSSNELTAEAMQLQSQLENSVKEKNDLIVMIQTKHQENVQYHTEIQRLGEMLTTEMAKARDCARCTELQAEAAMLKKNMNDRVQFLRESGYNMEKRLLADQQSMQQLLQRQSELITEKQSLTRDVERLREHLMEIEEAHTQETVELQKSIETTKLKMSSMQEDAKKSSTAYTSAR